MFIQYYLMQLWFSWVSPHIHSVNIGGHQRGKYKQISFQIGIVMATRAYVPTAVVELVSDVPSVSSVDYL